MRGHVSISFEAFDETGKRVHIEKESILLEEFLVNTPVVLNTYVRLAGNTKRELESPTVKKDMG